MNLAVIEVSLDVAVTKWSTVNETVVAPAKTLTVLFTVANFEFELSNETSSPDGKAGPSSTMVPVRTDVEPPTTEAELSVTL